jgi:agmatine/peptidylarginine deiminase
MAHNLITMLAALTILCSCNNPLVAPPRNARDGKSLKSLNSTATTRPIAEFAPAKAVMISKMTLSPPYDGASFVRALKTTGIPLLEVEANDSPSNLFVPHSDIWLRDFAPQWVEVRSGATNLPHLEARGLRYLKREPEDDRAAASIASRLAIPFADGPFQLDGGNILNDGTDCYTSAEPLGFQRRGPHEKQRLSGLKSHLGCRQLISLSGTPHDHIDMWAKFLSTDTVLVNEVTPDLLDYVFREHGALYQYVRAVQESLNQTASQLAMTKKVIRIPMPVPLPLMWRSYTNSLIINKFALIPRYRTSQMPGVSYPDTAILSALEAKVEKTYREQGFTPLWIDADSYIRRGGSLHCLAVAVPATPVENKSQDVQISTRGSRNQKL